jgi:myo-inositol-1(or 4)-monophosphatase
MTNTKKVAVEAAKLSAKKLTKIYEKFSRADIKMKSSHEIITEADLLSEKIIIKEIKKNFPDHRILSEESGDDDKKSDYLWIIDPIDGTTNFSMKNPI